MSAPKNRPRSRRFPGKRPRSRRLAAFVETSAPKNTGPAPAPAQNSANAPGMPVAAPPRRRPTSTRNSSRSRRRSNRSNGRRSAPRVYALAPTCAPASVASAIVEPVVRSTPSNPPIDPPIERLRDGNRRRARLGGAQPPSSRTPAARRAAVDRGRASRTLAELSISPDGAGRAASGGGGRGRRRHRRRRRGAPPSIGRGSPLIEVARDVAPRRRTGSAPPRR